MTGCLSVGLVVCDACCCCCCLDDLLRLRMTLTKWRRGDLIMPLANIIIYLKLCIYILVIREVRIIYSHFETQKIETVDQLDLSETISILGQL